MSPLTHTRRAILNFAHRCAMKCEWCYVPFEAPAAREHIVISVVQRIAELGFSSLTVGGGDPFQYRFLPNVLRVARALDLFVHVDTHAKGLRETVENQELIQSSVDLIGLPMDGSSPEIHDLMRNSPGHFDLILNRLHWLAPFRDRLKINTIVSAVNQHDLVPLAKTILAIQPARWSIYQYWALGPAAHVEDRHTLGQIQFSEIAEQALQVMLGSGTVVEVNTQDSRRDTYPIIHHEGEVFVHSAAPENKFISLGNLFEDETVDLVRCYCGFDRPVAATRYLRQAHYISGDR